MRAAIPWTLFAASLVVNVVFLSGAMVSGARELAKQQTVQSPGSDLVAQLNLDDSQRAGLDALREQARARGMAMREATVDLRQGLLVLLAAPEFNRETFTETLNEASVARRAMFIDVAEMLHGYLQSLDEGQREQVLVMAEDRGFLKAMLFGPEGGPSRTLAVPTRQSEPD